MANELNITYPTGNTLYSVLQNSVGQVYNGVGFEAPVNANWATYDIAMTEAGTTQIYRGNMPAVAAGVYSFTVRLQAGGAPAVGDIALGVGIIQWDGSAEISLYGVNVTLIEGVDATDQIGDAVADEIYEGALTLRNIIRVCLAALAGKSTGGGTASVAFRDVADAKDRIDATVTVNGNRTAVTLDGS